MSDGLTEEDFEEIERLIEKVAEEDAKRPANLPFGVLKLGYEGGGKTIIAQRDKDGELWYWSDGITMVLDDPEDGDEEWRVLQGGPSRNLEDLLTGHWYLIAPIAIKKQFIPVIRKLYDATLASADERDRKHAEHLRSRWQDAFNGNTRFRRSEIKKIQNSTAPYESESNRRQMKLFETGD